VSENTNKEVAKAAKFWKKATFGLFDYTSDESIKGTYTLEFFVTDKCTQLVLDDSKDQYETNFMYAVSQYKLEGKI